MTDTQETNEFDRVKYLENLLKISQETQEELAKRILKQQKTIGSLTDTIDELKAQNEKMKCCENCKNKKGWKGEKPCLDCKYNPFGEGKADKWELAE